MWNTCVEPIDNPNKISYNTAMTMHLVGPWLTTTGKKKGKRRFRTASNAAQARELQSDWQALLDRHGATPARQPRRKTDFEPMKRQPMQYRGSDQPRIPACPLPAQGDARRYRWLRRNCDALWKKYAPNPECTLDQFDAAIDAEVRK